MTLLFKRYAGVRFLDSTVTITHKNKANIASNLYFLQKKMKQFKRKKVTDISLNLWQVTLFKKNTTKDN